MAQPPADAPRDLGRWPARAVADRLGISTSTLRSWNHRYGIEPLDHVPGRHRLYSDADIAELQTIQRLVAAGTPPKVAASLLRAQQRDTPRGPERPPVHSARAIEAAAVRLDTSALTDAFDESLRTRGALETWSALARPVLVRLGRRVAERHECMDAEAVLTWALMASLHRSTNGSIDRSGPLALLACAEGEHHSLVLETLNAVLTEQGLHSCMLGPSVADNALLDAARRTRPALVVLAATRRSTARAAPLSELAHLTPHVIAAGPGWASADISELTVHRVEEVDALVELVTKLLRCG